MIIDNIPQSLLYPAYRSDIKASEQMRRIKACEERWKKLLGGYEAEIENFGAALDGIEQCNEELLNRLERNYLKRIFGNVTKLFGEVDAGRIYDTMMELYAGRYDLDYLFNRLVTLFGVRLRIVEAIDFRYGEKNEDVSNGEIVELLEMLLPADVYVKVSYAAKSGLGRDLELGKAVLERGFFVL